MKLSKRAILLRIGSRESQLAVAQANEAIMQIFASYNEEGLEFELVTTATTGDLTTQPFAQINQENMFTKEIEDMLLQNRVDVAVHSMKDVPVTEHAELEIACAFKQSSYLDSLVSNIGYKSIAALPPNCHVGTASARRKAQLLRLRPDINVVNLRGNVVTRLAKMRDNKMDAIILAAAGLSRLNVTDFHCVDIPIDHMLPSAGQGVLAAQIRKGDVLTKSIILSASDKKAWIRIQTERHFLRIINAGCGDPVAALAIVDDELRINAHFMILSLDGSTYHEAHTVGTDPYKVAANGAKLLKKYTNIWRDA